MCQCQRRLNNEKLFISAQKFQATTYTRSIIPQGTYPTSYEFLPPSFAGLDMTDQKLSKFRNPFAGIIMAVIIGILLGVLIGTVLLVIVFAVRR